MSFTGKEIIALEESGYKCISENCQNKDIRNNGMLCRFSYCYSAQSALVLDYYFDRSVYCINEYLSNTDEGFLEWERFNQKTIKTTDSVRNINQIDMRLDSLLKKKLMENSRQL